MEDFTSMTYIREVECLLTPSHRRVHCITGSNIYLSVSVYICGKLIERYTDVILASGIGKSFLVLSNKN